MTTVINIVAASKIPQARYRHLRPRLADNEPARLPAPAFALAAH